MIKPILACQNPYLTAEKFKSAGWAVDFSNPPESGDPLVGVSLFGNEFLLGITQGYVETAQLPYVGCGVEFYLTVPSVEMQKVHAAHAQFFPTELSIQPWGDTVFEVKIDGFEFMIVGKD